MSAAGVAAGVTSPTGPEGYAATVSSVGRGTAIMAISTVLLLLFNFLGRVGVARAFSVDAWGEFNIGLALVGLLSMSSLLGLNQALARSLAFETDPAERRALVRWAIVVTAAASAVVSTLVWAFAPELAAVYHDPALTPVFELFAPAVGFTMLGLLLASIFQGFEDAGPNAWYNGVIAPGLFVVLLVAVLVLHLGFLSAVLVYSASLGVAFALLVIHSVRKLPALLPPTAARIRRPKPGLWRLSVALWGVSSLSFVTAYVDTLILGVFRSAADVGFYSAGMTLARLLLVGNGALTYVYLPAAARLARQRDLDTLRRTFVTATRWTLAITVPMFLLFFLLPGASLVEVFGASYRSATLPLEILVLGSFVSVTLGPVNACLAGMGHARPLLLTTAFAALTNVALSFGLIPLYGAVGAAVAWTVARVLYPGSGLLYLHRAHRISPFGRILAYPLAVTLAVGVPLFFLVGTLPLRHWIVFPMYFLGVGLFLAALLATRSLDPGDLLATSFLERLVRRPLPGLRRFLGRFMHAAPASPTEAVA